MCFLGVGGCAGCGGQNKMCVGVGGQNKVCGAGWGVEGGGAEQSVHGDGRVSWGGRTKCGGWGGWG